MKTDTIFYQLFQSFPSIFFELIQLPITEANNYRFDSVEVKQLSFRLDGVFLPQNNHPQTPIYFCEVQFQEDEAFYRRFFTEIFLYLSKTDLTNDWRGVIVYPNPQVGLFWFSCVNFCYELKQANSLSRRCSKLVNP
jgi:predicted transposase/invertase (TIGR01784 family)